MSSIDTHVHIDFYNNFNKTLSDYAKNEIYTIFVTNLPEIYESHRNKFDFKYNKYVKLALGYHPEMTGSYKFNYDLFKKYVNDTDYIGEVGLNYTSKVTNLPEQMDIFNSICALISSSPKVLSIHSRGAEKEVLNILAKNNVKFPILHWYSGPIKLIKDFADIGCYFSVNPSMLKSVKGNTILKNIPLNRILFETDGPFTKFNKEIVNPSVFKEIYTEFSEFYNVDNYSELVFDNFKKLIFEKYNYKSSILKSK